MSGLKIILLGVTSSLPDNFSGYKKKKNIQT